MKKILLSGFILIIQHVCAQITSKDPAFASNGIFSMPGNIAWSRMIQNSDGSIYFTSGETNSTTGLTDSFLSKLTPNGTLDNTFGINGKFQLQYGAYDSQMKRQADGKFFIISFHSDDLNSINYTDITRFLPNGQIDTSFGINGTASISNMWSDLNIRGYGLLLQNNKVIIYGEATTGFTYSHYRIIYRLNENGSIDTSFGNNGFITTQGRFVFLDNQLNTVVLEGTTIEKYNINGQPLTGFGNNGVVTHSIPYGYIGAAYMDSNNNIVYSNLNAEIGRITPNGVQDPTFTFDPASLPFATWILNIIEKNGYYYIGGMNEGSDPRYFISRLTQNGSIDPVFGYFSETDPNLELVGDMIVNDNNIIANGSGHIVKYLLNSGTLSSSEIVKSNTNISFENPVKQNLIYKTREKISKIEVYSGDGKLVKTLKENNSDVSELPMGIYMTKVTFENGKTVSKKLIKN
ncbi:putative delta-60 repeat protein [Chryseobacterium defluvii]|uniref:Putative delta-60 repeat protein n=1 Tax=Chryseobacterium defluvii TaxID=160396 RepID=A0A840KEX4_9FLAO|nr:T9SS type A sorting domain-containing protein [Chryseobacterium defluvii]MBB4807736.1 putative delta-60 repeat protein [Chryseobacterium defluvii]